MAPSPCPPSVPPALGPHNTAPAGRGHAGGVTTDEPEQSGGQAGPFMTLDIHVYADVS